MDRVGLAGGRPRREGCALALDPDDPIGVGRALCAWLARRHGTTVELAEVPVAVGEGFDNRIYRLRFAGDLPPELTGPLVARIQQDADRLAGAEREARIQGWCADRGYPAPRVVAILGPDDLVALPTQLVERAPGRTMLDVIRRAPWRTPALVRRLAELHVRLHRLSPEGWPEEAGGPLALAERRLAFVEGAAGRLADREIAVALERVHERVLPRLAVDDPAVCHGDFHPLNVLIDGGHSAVIDWTDAGLGDRHGDVARTVLLFGVAAVVATGALERRVLTRVGPWLARRYLDAYRAELDVDARRLDLWEPLHLLHGWTQVVAATAGMFDDAAPERVRDVRPELGEWLRSRFEDRMAALNL